MRRTAEILERYVLAVLIGILFALIIRQASLFEDAYITFRVVHNAVSGYGLRWNIDERVQVFTHPLWMLLHIPFYAAWQNIYAISIGLSLACTAAAAAFALRVIKLPPINAALVFIAPLAASKTFVIYSTSGFENTLSHALFACFCLALLYPPKKYFWFFLSFITALSLFNRLDLAVFYFPIWSYLLFTRLREIKWGEIAVGALPLVLWLAFSFFYYGFLFPNTKYAKINTGIETAQYISLGGYYLLNFFSTDIVSAACIMAMVTLMPWLFKRRLDLFFLALGALIYIAYVVYVGGNFLGGRLLSLPFFTAAIIVALAIGNNIEKRHLYMLAFLLALISAFYPSDRNILSACRTCFKGIAWRTANKEWWLLTDALQGKINLPQPAIRDRKNISIAGSMGVYGYSMKPHVKIIDRIGICDPLTARLPAIRPLLTNTGLLYRKIPDGYPYARQTGRLTKMDPSLAVYYKSLHFIVAGDLWSVERLREIMLFNAGVYDEFKENYIARQAMSRRAKPSGQSIKSTAL